ILSALRAHGVEIADVILHVGAGTFKPVEVDDPAQHVMHEEWYEVPALAARQIASARSRGAKTWAVGRHPYARSRARQPQMEPSRRAAMKPASSSVRRTRSARSIIC